jgi:hypothetical protein
LRTRDRRIEIPDDLVRRNTDDAIPRALERLSAPRIGALAPDVRAAVDLDDEP